MGTIDDLFCSRSLVKFYVGLHQPSDAKYFQRSFVSVNRLVRRLGFFPANDWIMDSGAFTEVSTHGHYRTDVREYARVARRWVRCGRLESIVAQDFMCEAFILKKTGLTIPDHQRLTIERYDALVQEDLSVPIMPVLQGFAPDDYRRHLDQYGARLTSTMRVGVGSVCKRNGTPAAIVSVLSAISRERPDLRLHGFGLKKTALANLSVREMLYSADSMAWSFAARREGRNQNDWREAKKYEQDVLQLMVR